jgi:hypothetical protein
MLLKLVRTARPRVDALGYLADRFRIADLGASRVLGRNIPGRFVGFGSGVEATAIPAWIA